LIFTILDTFNFRHSLWGWPSPFTLLSAFVSAPDWIWLVYIFAFGCCVGSFLNVVIYRLPRDMSIIKPPSSCPGCGKRIRFYDNIPLVSWLVLGAKCRYCKAAIRPRYFLIELLTGSVFLGLFILYFRTGFLPDMEPFWAGGWFIYLLHITLLAAFIAASAIDLELWVIPLSICWLVTAAGFIGSAAGGYLIDPLVIREYWLLPIATAKTGSLAVGATAGLVISLVLLATGLLKRSYETEDPASSATTPWQEEEIENRPQTTENRPQTTADREQKPVLSEAEGTEDREQNPVLSEAEGTKEQIEPQINHRLETCREIVFLLPIIACSIAAYRIIGGRDWWVNFLQYPAAAGLLGSVWGYFVGCGIVWAIRIFGAFVFGKEAMGLGDVHLMGAAGAVTGPVFVVVSFFIAPFFGLGWAGFHMFFKKIRQIPYGPFLSLGVFIAMILHDRIRDYINFVFEPLFGSW